MNEEFRWVVGDFGVGCGMGLGLAWGDFGWFWGGFGVVLGVRSLLLRSSPARFAVLQITGTRA